MRSSSVLAFFVTANLALGCAGMIVGSHDWFERKRSDVEPKAAADLGCTGKPVDFAPVSHDDYREVEARACGKKARYRMIKVGPVESWEKASDVSSL